VKVGQVGLKVLGVWDDFYDDVGECFEGGGLDTVDPVEYLPLLRCATLHLGK
jgi:hypothetical protein